MAGEFELIARHLSGRGAVRADVRLGVGDDAALVVPPPGRELALALDTIVSGVHFPADLEARLVGHRALAVNLSDAAAMGAEPAWALLGLTLPAGDEDWVREFADGFDALARRHGVALVGGDTTRGPLAATVLLAGTVAPGRALRRGGAAAGDDVWISGHPGDAAAGLAILQGRLAAGGAAREALVARFALPEPRVALGAALAAGLASACIDVSDGLAADLGRLCEASGAGAEIDAGALPLSEALLAAAGQEAARRYALDGGDDYELAFTAPPARRAAIEALADPVPLARIGRVSTGPGLRIAGAGRRDASHGFDHFG